jgi:hypothetical protein
VKGFIEVYSHTTRYRVEKQFRRSYTSTFATHITRSVYGHFSSGFTDAYKVEIFLLDHLNLHTNLLKGEFLGLNIIHHTKQKWLFFVIDFLSIPRVRNKVCIQYSKTVL